MNTLLTVEDWLIKNTSLTLDEFLSYAEESVKRARRDVPRAFPEADKLNGLLKNEKLIINVESEMDFPATQFIYRLCAWRYMPSIKAGYTAADAWERCDADFGKWIHQLRDNSLIDKVYIRSRRFNNFNSFKAEELRKHLSVSNVSVEEYLYEL